VEVLGLRFKILHEDTNALLYRDVNGRAKARVLAKAVADKEHGVNAASADALTKGPLGICQNSLAAGQIGIGR